MRALCRIHLATLLPPRVIHGNAPLGALHEDDEDDRRDTADEHHNCRCGRHFAIAHELGSTCHRGRHARHDAGENDHGDTVADAALGNLLTQPHQEHRARNQRNARRDQEARPRIDDEPGLILQPGRRGDRLEARQCNRAPARVLDDLAPALLTFLAQLLQARDDVARHLHDDRRRDIRHDAEREQAEARQCAAREQIEQAQQIAGLLIEEILERNRIDAGHGNERADAEDNQRADEKQQTSL